MPHPKNSFFTEKNFLAAIIILVASLGSYVNVLVVSAAPYIQADLQVSVFSISILLSCFPLGLTLGHLFFANRAKFYNPSKIFLSGALLVFCSACLSYLFSFSLFPLVLLFFLQSLGVSVVGLSARVCQHHLTAGDEKRLVQYLTLDFLSYLVGEITSPLLLVLLVTYFVWPSIYLFIASFAAFFSFLIWWKIYQHPLLSRPEGLAQGRFLDALHNQQFVAFTCVAIVSHIWLYIFYVGIPFTMKFVFLTSDFFYGSFLSLNLIVSMFASFLNLYLVRFLSPRKLLLPSAWVTLICAVAFFCSVLSQLWVYEVFLLAFLIMNFAITFILINGLSLAFSSCSASEIACAAGLHGFLVYLASFMGSLVTGFILNLPLDKLVSLALWLLLVSLLLVLACLPRFLNKKGS